MKLEEASHFRLFSDIHLDFYVGKKFKPENLWEPEVLPEDKDSVLILAGDIWHAKKPFKFSNYSWFEKMSERFKYVVVVLGNHDFWDGMFPKEYANFERYKKEQNLNNVYLLQDSILEIGDYKLVGATLWTSLGSRSIDVMTQYERSNNDLKYMRWIDPRYPNTFKRMNFKPLVEANIKSKNFIFENAKKDYPEQKVMVISHHPPCRELINDPQMTEIDFQIDCNDFSKEIESSEIDYWMHGHNHQSGEKVLGNTKILANTLGYLSSSLSKEEFDPNFDPWHQVKLENIVKKVPKIKM